MSALVKPPRIQLCCYTSALPHSVTAAMHAWSVECLQRECPESICLGGESSLLETFVDSAAWHTMLQHRVPSDDASLHSVAVVACAEQVRSLGCPLLLVRLLLVLGAAVVLLATPPTPVPPPQSIGETFLERCKRRIVG